MTGDASNAANAGTGGFAPPVAAAMIHDRLAPTIGAAAGAGARVGSIGGSPTDDEVAAVMAAVEHLWPKPVLVLPVDTARPTPPWRFSGRWWIRPSAARRSRPYT